MLQGVSQVAPRDRHPLWSHETGISRVRNLCPCVSPVTKIQSYSILSLFAEVDDKRGSYNGGLSYTEPSPRKKIGRDSASQLISQVPPYSQKMITAELPWKSMRFRHLKNLSLNNNFISLWAVVKLVS